MTLTAVQNGCFCNRSFFEFFNKIGAPGHLGGLSEYPLSTRSSLSGLCRNQGIMHMHRVLKNRFLKQSHFLEITI
jgi:hypothetical protein